MAETFFISDTHFGHEKTCTTFQRSDGTPLRPFANAEEMDEQMIQRWNAIVRPEDKVYHLGDVCIKKQYLKTLVRLNGNKRLIRGNHDVFKTKEYMQYFKEIYGVRVLDDCILSHIPLDAASITTRFHVNVHGHLHSNQKMMVSQYGKIVPDPRYVCVCVEHINYTPLPYDDLRKLWTEKQKLYGHMVPIVALDAEGPG